MAWTCARSQSACWMASSAAASSRRRRLRLPRSTRRSAVVRRGGGGSSHGVGGLNQLPPLHCGPLARADEACDRLVDPARKMLTSNVPCALCPSLGGSGGIVSRRVGGENHGGAMGGDRVIGGDERLCRCCCSTQRAHTLRTPKHRSHYHVAWLFVQHNAQQGGVPGVKGVFQRGAVKFFLQLRAAVSFILIAFPNFSTCECKTRNCS